MVKPKTPPKASPLTRHDISAEATSYLQGMFQEFYTQVAKYEQQTQELHSLEGRIELTEKTLSLIRDHLAMAVENTDSATPRDWSQTLGSVRFVGVRLADACMALLQENKKMSPHEIMVGLNKGMFRFRTSSPLREIHAALLRQTFANKVGQSWVWTGIANQLPLRLRVMARPSTRHVNQDEQTEQASK